MVLVFTESDQVGGFFRFLPVFGVVFRRGFFRVVLLLEWGVRARSSLTRAAKQKAGGHETYCGSLDGESGDAPSAILVICR